MTELSKPALRAELRAARDLFVLDMKSGQRQILEARAAAHLAPLLGDATCVAFYMARGSEIDCGPAIAAVVARGIGVVLPHVSGLDVPMRFLAWAPGEPLVESWRGLLQPAADAPEVAPDVIVAPLLGFDSAGRRIGQGAGFYDRAFAERPGVKKFALGWSIQQRPIIASDSWDVPLDAVVTEAGVMEKDRRL